MRHLSLKSRELGVFCNISPTMLTDAGHFKQFLDFMDANRALANSLILEFTQSAHPTFGPIEPGEPLRAGRRLPFLDEQ
jgi:cyclic-di-GMP phosphodiesterase, flagellum assembly factor TipF